MTNEVVLILNLIFIYGSMLVWLKFFGKSGLICFNLIVTIAANIEVLILVSAFGMQQTLGNILFSSTFLVTDVLSEVHDKKSANRAVTIGIFSTVFFMLITQTWFLYTPAREDVVFEHIKKIFSKTSRTMITGVLVYAVTQYIDVFLYHAIWNLTRKLSNSNHKFLWIRNNFSTLISQFINTVLFTILAFGGVYDVQTILSIMMSSYAVFVMTSISDTPIIYIARKIASTNFK